ncbi:MAG: DUF4258 domain-containing protein [Bryobacteraceae bacterium]|nr:DUF4258 domain-containing protein [Bryobacteraceae bacterium]
MSLLPLVREAAEKKILFLPHAVRQMSRPDRVIGVAEVRNCVTTGDLIEDYPEDVRGHSCLILGNGEDPLTSPIRHNGKPISRPGDPNEVRTLSRHDAALDGAVSRRPEGLSSVAR